MTISIWLLIRGLVQGRRSRRSSPSSTSPLTRSEAAAAPEGFRDHLRDARAHAVSTSAVRRPAEAEAVDHLGHAQCRASISRPPRTANNVVLCGTQLRPRSHRAAGDGPDPGTDPQYRPRERAHARGRALADTFSAFEIEGKTLGVIGLGKLGAKVSRLAQAFGMNVIAWSPNLTPEKCKEVGRHLRQQGRTVQDRRYRHHPCGAEPRSRGLVGRADLAADEADRYIVNTARGPIIDEDRVAGSPAAEEDRGRRASTCSRSNRCRSTTPSASSTTWCSRRISATSPRKVFATTTAQMVEGIDAWFKGEPVRRLA